jgi:hypothetical protein
MLSSDSSDLSGAEGVLDILKIPALALFGAALGSGALCGVQSTQKQRSLVIWVIKGLLGGPFSVRQLVELPAFVVPSPGEEEQQSTS